MTSTGDVPSEGQPPFTEARFERFHEETFDSVWALARRICRDEAEAHDIAQVAYVAVYRYWRDGRLREPPTHLLFRVARRGAIDVLRGRARRQRLFAALPKRVETDLVETDLRDALRSLRPEDASLVMLHSASGFTYEELARIENVSVAAVRNRLFRARAQLRRALYGHER